MVDLVHKGHFFFSIRVEFFPIQRKFSLGRRAQSIEWVGDTVIINLVTMEKTFQLSNYI